MAAGRFDKYLTDLVPGATPEELAAETAAPSRFDKYADPSVAEDIAMGIPSALGRIPFAIAGAPAAALEGGMQLGRWIDQNVLGNEEVETPEQVSARNPLKGMMPGELERRFFEEPTGVEMYDPRTKTGQVVSSGITGAGAGLLTAGVGGGAGGMVESTVAGGAGGAGAEFARQQFEGSPYETLAMLLGGLGGSLVAPGLRRAVTPRYVAPELAEAAAYLRSQGVRNITEGQLTQGRRLRAAERKRVPENWQMEQYKDFTEAALSRIGVRSRLASPEVMDDFLGQMDRTYTRLTGRNQLEWDQQFATEFADPIRVYNGRVSPPNRAPLIEDYQREVLNLMRQGPRASGAAYQSLRSRLRAEARSNSNSDVQQAANGMATALDNAMERSIGRLNPRDLGAFQAANRTYRNYLVIRDAVTRGGENAAGGIITPAALDSAVRRIYGETNWLRGHGDFTMLSRSGARILTPLEPTGTAPLLRNPADMNAIAMLAYPVMEAGRRVRMTPGVQRYLTNRLMPPPGGRRQHAIRGTAPVYRRPGGDFSRAFRAAVPSLAEGIDQNYSPIVDELVEGAQGPASPIDPRIQAIIDAMGGVAP